VWRDFDGLADHGRGAPIVGGRSPRLAEAGRLARRCACTLRFEASRWRGAASSNNRAENSHQPAGRREFEMQTFKTPGSTQRFLPVHAAVHNTFNTRRHLTSRKSTSRPQRRGIRHLENGGDGMGGNCPRKFSAIPPSFPRQCLYLLDATMPSRLLRLFTSHPFHLKTSPCQSLLWTGRGHIDVVVERHHQ
jgi:hypothetical protein